MTRTKESNSYTRNQMFTVQQRNNIRNRVLEIARADPRVTAGALTGSSAIGAEDEWSDIDVYFGVTDGTSVLTVLDDWTEIFRREFDIVHYWDLPFSTSIYRVFLLPSGLEIDVAVTPQQDYGARGPRFRTLFGATRQIEPAPPPSSRYLIGLGWHHVFHARSRIRRGKPWQAAYWIAGVRDQTLALACLRLGNETAYAKGADDLPTAITEPLKDSLVRSLDEPELRRALGVATACFIGELEAWDSELTALLKPLLQEFGSA